MCMTARNKSLSCWFVTSWLYSSLLILFLLYFTKTVPRSDMITLGTPWSLTISCRKSWARSFAEKGCLSLKKCAYLLRRSTITRIEFHPLDLGKPSIKSIVSSSHIWEGIGSGCKKPAGVSEDDLQAMQVGQLLTYCWMSFSNINFETNADRSFETPHGLWWGYHEINEDIFELGVMQPELPDGFYIKECHS